MLETVRALQQKRARMRRGPGANAARALPEGSYVRLGVGKYRAGRKSRKRKSARLVLYTSVYAVTSFFAVVNGVRNPSHRVVGCVRRAFSHLCEWTFRI
eukprot:COSAG03_NODE_7890_length_860_cov_1.001314_1_plen_98_part_01